MRVFNIGESFLTRFDGVEDRWKQLLVPSFLQILFSMYILMWRSTTSKTFPPILRKAEIGWRNCGRRRRADWKSRFLEWISYNIVRFSVLRFLAFIYKLCLYFKFRFYEAELHKRRLHASGEAFVFPVSVSTSLIWWNENEIKCRERLQSIGHLCTVHPRLNCAPSFSPSPIKTYISSGS